MKIKKLNEKLEPTPVVEELQESIEPVTEEVIEESSENIEEVVECDERLEEAVKDYCKFAQIEEGVEIEGDLDEWALNEAAAKHSIAKYDLRHRLTEARGETLDDLAREQESIIDEEDTRTEIEKTLDRAFARNKTAQRKGRGANFQAVLIEGDMGVGKSMIVKQWAKDHGLNPEEIEAYTLNPEALLGIPDVHPTEQGMVLRRFSTELLVPCSKPNTILFVDEYNRADYQSRFFFGNLAKYHTISIPNLGEETTQEVFGKYGQVEGGKLYFPNLIMVVAAQNPFSDVYTGTNPLDAAEYMRFKYKKVAGDPLAVLRYFRKVFGQEIEEAKEAGDTEELEMLQGRLGLAEALLSSPKFRFQSTSDIEKLYNENPSNRYLNPRSLEDALRDSDGTKDDLIAEWDDICGHSTKNMIKDILKNYVDIKDKANDALKGGTKSSVFGGESSTLWDELVAENPDLDSE